MPQSQIATPEEIAKYYLIKSINDGELVSPLKMQKLVYYAYVWTLIKNKKKLFDEKIEAWANGPVAPSLYHALQKYGSAPIDENFLQDDDESVQEVINKIPPEVKKTLDQVYDEYMTKTAFELVMLTHSEKPWVEARKGLEPNEKGSKPISDKDIIDQYSS